MCESETIRNWLSIIDYLTFFTFIKPCYKSILLCYKVMMNLWMSSKLFYICYWKWWKLQCLTSLWKFHKTTHSWSCSSSAWWNPMGKLAVKGSDGLIKAVNIRTNCGRTNHPIAQLYPLEVYSDIPKTLLILKPNDEVVEKPQPGSQPTKSAVLRYLANELIY